MQGILRTDLSGLSKSDLEDPSRASHRAEEAQTERSAELGQKAPSSAIDEYIPFGANLKRSSSEILK